MKIIYATKNKDKVKQVEEYFKYNNIDIEIKSLNDIKFEEEIDENGNTFEENSLIKAKAIKKFCDKNGINDIIVADDAGLCVDALNGNPGVHTARYAGNHAAQEVVLKKLLDEMEGIPLEKRTASFICILTAILPNGEIIISKGETRGIIAEKIGTQGKLTFGPVLIPEGFDRVINDLTEEELGDTHRLKAFKELIKKII